MSEARAQAHELVALAEADAARFSVLRALDAAAPGLFRTTRMLDDLVEGAGGNRIVVVGRSDGVETDLDLEERVGVEEVGLGEQFLSELCPTCEAPVEANCDTCPRCETELEAQ